MLAATPAGFITCIVGLFVGAGRKPAIAGLVISGLAGLLFFVLPVVAMIFCLMQAA